SVEEFKNRKLPDTLRISSARWSPPRFQSDDASRRNVFKGTLVGLRARGGGALYRLPEGAEGDHAARPRHGEGEQARRARPRLAGGQRRQPCGARPPARLGQE